MAIALVVAAAMVCPGPASAATAGAPIVTIPPTNLTAAPGQPAAFYAVATGTPLPSPHWQVKTPGTTSFVNIPNANGLSYHFAALAGDNGNQYRAEFINSAGRAVSRTATLTVRAGLPGPFVEMIFSRSEMTAADNCVPDDTGIARLDTTIAPYLASLGMTATGSVETAPAQQSADWCAHYNDTMVSSWDQLSALGARGWTFVSHSADYPYESQIWSAMTPDQMWAETCGSAQVIDAHGLKGGSDVYLWPNSTGQPGSINEFALSTYVEPCFGTSRVYSSGISATSDLSTSPYRQSVRGATGGSCNTSGLPCSRAGQLAYRTPAQIISAIQSLQPGQVMTLQAYVLVTGKNPPYSSNNTRWDCTSSNPNLHWTNDAERYCWSDLQQVFNYLVRSGKGITQPGVVNAAAGRTGYSDQPTPPAPTNVQASAGDTVATVQWQASSSVPAGPITGYTVTSSPGGMTANVDGSTTSATVNGLTDGTAYTFSVQATTYLGTSASSDPSNPVTPEPPPP